MRPSAADCVGSLPEAALQERLAMASSALGLDAKTAEALEKKVDPTAPNSKAARTARSARAGSSSSSSSSSSITAPITAPIKAPKSKAARVARRRESAAGAAAAVATATTATATAAQVDRHMATDTLKPVRIGGRHRAELETAREAAGTSPLPQVETHDELR